MIYLVDFIIVIVVTGLFGVIFFRLEEGRWPWEEDNEVV